MKRPRPHSIDTEAQILFLRSLPSSWVVNKLQLDYGLDYHIEVFDDEEPTGIFFHVQLKGSTSPKYINESLALSFEVDKLTYYFDKVPTPVFVVVADLKNEKCFWLFIQRYIQRTLYPQKPRWRAQRHVNIHIPTRNQLPESSQSLQQVAEDGRQEVFVLQLDRPSLHLSLKIKEKLYDKQAILDATRTNELEAGELKLSLADVYLIGEEPEKAIQALSSIFEDTKTCGPAEIHIASAMKLVHALGFVHRKDNRQCAHIVDLALKRQNECKYKHWVLVAKAEKAFLDFIYSLQQIQSFGLFIEIARQQQRRGSHALLEVLQLEAAQAYLKANDDMHSLVSAAIDSNELAAATEILVRIADAYLFGYPFVRIKEGKERAAPILESAGQRLELAKQMAESLLNPERVCHILQSEAYLLFLDDNPKYQNVLSNIKDIATANSLPHFQKAASDLLHIFKETEPLPEEVRSYKTEAELTEEEEVTAIRELAKFSGLDLSDESDEIAQVINLGIRDRNPERVLRFCQHLYWAITSYGIPGEMFGLPTAGGKLLYCSLKKEAIGGMSLDEMLEIFKRQYCENCRNRLPHPSTWRWTREWQRERDKNMPDGLRKMLRNFYHSK